jgi:hypothetical protein
MSCCCTPQTNLAFDPLNAMEKQPSLPQAATPERVKDPVCGMSVVPGASKGILVAWHERQIHRHSSTLLSYAAAAEMLSSDSPVRPSTNEAIAWSRFGQSRSHRSLRASKLPSPQRASSTRVSALASAVEDASPLTSCT